MCKSWRSVTYSGVGEGDVPAGVDAGARIKSAGRRCVVPASEVVVADARLVMVSALDARDVTGESPTSDVSVCPGVDDPMNMSSVFMSVIGEDAVEPAVMPSKEYMEAM